jgi:hypothetical protein
MGVVGRPLATSRIERTGKAEGSAAAVVSSGAGGAGARDAGAGWRDRSSGRLGAPSGVMRAPQLVQNDFPPIVTLAVLLQLGHFTYLLPSLLLMVHHKAG